MKQRQPKPSGCDVTTQLGTCHPALPTKPHLKDAVAAFPTHVLRRTALGQIDLLTVGRLASLGEERQPTIGHIQLDTLLRNTGKLNQNQHTVIFLVNIDQRLAYVLALGAIHGASADVAERLDLQLRLPLIAQSGLDIDSIDAANPALIVLEFAGAREFLAGFGQLAQLFDESAEPAEQTADAERTLDDFFLRVRRILFFVIFGNSCHGNSP